MCTPKRIEEISVEDLSRSRWCYFHDDEGGYDSFEWVIPATHPKFSEEIMELELATFRFQGGEELKGMYDGVKNFIVHLAGEWYAFWFGGIAPTELDKQKLKAALGELGLRLPVSATAEWSRVSQTYHGIRYYDEDGRETEA